MNNQATALTKAEEPKPEAAPIFIEAERMYNKFSETSREIARRAFDFFAERGHGWGSQFDDWFRAEREILRPAPVELTETPEYINVKLAVPGFKPDEIEISLKDDLLMMSGETTFEEKKEDETTFYSEWKSNRFARKLTLPAPVLSENVKAELKDGVLALSLKKAPVTEPTRIEVNPS